MIAEITTESNTDQLDVAMLHMRQALLLAARRRGFCAPNPPVGAVVCQGGRVVGQGYHHAAGADHAEVVALKDAGTEARGATMYVTLEPCSHWGRTPPCVDALLNHGIAVLYYAHPDPNPTVQCHDGLARLRAAGVSCHYLPMVEAQAFYQSYVYWLQHKRPWVTTKLAMSLDAKVAGPGGVPVTMTAEAAKCYTHERRCLADVVLTSVRTVLADDPWLNVRLAGGSHGKALAIVDTHARLPLQAKCLQAATSVTVYYVSASAQRLEKLAAGGVRCVQLPASPGGVDLAALMADIGRYAHDVWVESGPVLQHALLAGGLVASHLRYIAPRLLGSSGYGLAVSDDPTCPKPVATQWWPLGQDMCCQMDYVEQPQGLPLTGNIGYHWGLALAQWDGGL